MKWRIYNCVFNVRYLPIIWKNPDIHVSFSVICDRDFRSQYTFLSANIHFKSIELLDLVISIAISIQRISVNDYGLEN